MSVIKNILTIEVPVELSPPKWDIWWNNPENNREFDRFKRVFQNYVFLHMYFRYSFGAGYRMTYFF